MQQGVLPYSSFCCLDERWLQAFRVCGRLLCWSWREAKACWTNIVLWLILIALRIWEGKASKCIKFLFSASTSQTVPDKAGLTSAALSKCRLIVWLYFVLTLKQKGWLHVFFFFFPHRPVVKNIEFVKPFLVVLHFMWSTVSYLKESFIYFCQQILCKYRKTWSQI